MTLPVARDLAVVGVRVQHDRARPHRHPHLRVGRGVGGVQAKLKRDVVFPDRLGTPEEFASLALELFTNSYMNGETIRIDGGCPPAAEVVCGHGRIHHGRPHSRDHHQSTESAQRR